MKTVLRLLIAGLAAGFTYTQTASAQYPGYATLPQYPTNYSYNSPTGYYTPNPYPHHHRYHHHGPAVVSGYAPAYASPGYTSLYGGNIGYPQQQSVVVPSPSVYTTNNYYPVQNNRNHPWHLGHYLLGN